MVTIVYDGLPGGGSGNLFEGVKFWVAQRVPGRQTTLQRIQDNGGIIVPLEKHADTLIADHAIPKKAPPGAISWTFIEQSIKQGMLEPLEKHAIVVPGVSKPSAGAVSGPKKGFRTPYTAEDDAALVKCVLSSSENRSGNKLYEKFAITNDRHTWHSWRDRWVKNLRHLDMESLQAMAARAPEEEPTASVNSPEKTISAANPRSPNRRVTQPPATKSPAGKEPRLQHPSQPQPGTPSSRERYPSPKVMPLHKQQTTPATPASRRKTISSLPSEADESPIDDSQKQALRAQFYSDLNSYIERTGVAIELQPRIIGKGVELFDLNWAVTEQEGGVEDVNWQKVARDVGFERSARPLAASQLRRCFQETLLDFLREMEDSIQATASNEAQEDESGEDDEEDAFETAPMIQARHVSAPSPSLSTSPVPQQSQAKRPRDEIEVERPRYSSKRRRLGPDDEIPATPQGKIMPVKHRRGAGQATSRSSAAKPSREVHRDPPQLPAEESTVDVTPTQQLHYEDFRAQPHPIRFEDQEPSSTEGRSSFQRVQSAPRRSLPSSFNNDSQGEVGPSSTKGIPVPTPSSKRSGGARPSSILKQKPKSNHEQISYWVEHYESLGYSHKIVLEGLRRTTMKPGGLASEVMQSLKEGRGVPSHHEGIWTNRDDKGLRMVDSVDTHGKAFNAEEEKARRKAEREFHRLENKHGQEDIELRRAFLKATDEVRSSQDGPIPY